MADAISSNHDDGSNPKFSASEDPQSSFQLENSISVDEKGFNLIVSNQNQECEVMINGASSSSPEENLETSVEKMFVCDSTRASSENGGIMRSMVSKIQNLDLEVEKEPIKVDAVHDSESIGASGDDNQEVAMVRVEETDFARSVLNLDGDQDRTMKESASMEANSKKELEMKESHSESILEMKKRMLLEELEALLVPGEEIHIEKGNNPPSLGGIVDNCGKTILIEEEKKIAGKKNDSINMNVLRNSLKIEVIDETALVEPVLVSNFGNGEEIGIVCPTRSMQMKANKSHHDPERGAKKAKRSRRKAREMKVPEVHWNVGNVNELDRVDGRSKNAVKNKIVYSRKDMEALRFVNVAEQRRLWEAICKELMPVVANEYSSLTSSNYPLKIGSTSGSNQHLEKREEASSIISVVAARGRWNQMNIFVH